LLSAFFGVRAVAGCELHGLKLMTSFHNRFVVSFFCKCHCYQFLSGRRFSNRQPALLREIGSMQCGMGRWAAAVPAVAAVAAVVMGTMTVGVAQPAAAQPAASATAAAAQPAASGWA
jgi:hypothetical protein